MHPDIWNGLRLILIDTTIMSLGVTEWTRSPSPKLRTTVAVKRLHAFTTQREKALFRRVRVQGHAVISPCNTATTVLSCERHMFLSDLAYGRRATRYRNSFILYYHIASILSAPDTEFVEQ